MEENGYIKEKKRHTMLYAIMDDNIDKVIEIIKIAKEYGCIDVVNYPDDDGATPLMYAVVFDRMEIAVLLIKEGADIDVQDKIGLTALMHAVIKNNLRMIEFLIDQGADLEKKTNFGGTALFLATVKEEGYKMVKVLLDAGADTNIVTSTGSTPLSMAISNNNMRMVNLLLKNGYEIRDVDIKDILYLGAEVLEMLWKRTGKKTKNEIKEKLLLQCIKKGFYDAGEFLLKEGADPFVKIEGRSLYNTVMQSKDDIWKELFIKYADKRKGNE